MQQPTELNILLKKVSRVHRLQTDFCWLVGVFFWCSVPNKSPTLKLYRHNFHLFISMTKQNLFPNPLFNSVHRTLETRSLLRLGNMYTLCILIVTSILIGK